MQNEITIEDMPTLRRLSRDIESAFDAATYKAGQAKQLGNDAIKEAIICGVLLMRAKAMVPPRRWSYWLAQCCPKLPHRTAYRWIQLAKASKIRTLEHCSGLRQAYIDCGILPEPEPTNVNVGPPAPDSIVRSLSCVSRHAIGPEIILSWPEDQRTRFLDALRELVHLYAELSGLPPP